MNGSQSSMIFLLVFLVLMIILMWWTSRKQMNQQKKVKDFRESLKPGDEVATVSGLLGTVHSVDLPHDEIVIDSEGSLSKWRIQAITQPPIRPAYVSDDEVDEDGNPLPAESDTAAEDINDDAANTTYTADSAEGSIENESEGGPSKNAPEPDQAAVNPLSAEDQTGFENSAQ
ncbi:preprotein translocase subunit [Scardovia inopinata]|uniref:Preprotein translocase, YajC subunit n=1 Tax=Scardovia inopinata F0304 TaxID=641146 RepID=W5IJU5_SCAIO|nr:preprotein translocase subunit YajC [Scardovia inopinata]EFG27129.2 preprotein translocase, YajC subunit [Scardovia inopinata F0304]BAR06744.1 conserved hypothetical protein [Scardovia inopinata JCM 12537]SUV50803.1 preprotein translocase subunit [Scardovia inopinata]